MIQDAQLPTRTGTILTPLSVLSLAAAALLLAGCGSTGNSNSTDGADNASGRSPGSGASAETGNTGGRKYSVTLDTVLHGSLQTEPEITHGQTLPEGTRITLNAQADPGYALDSVYYSVAGPWGPMYFESTEATMEVTLTQDISLGASFLPEKDVAGFSERQDILYAQPGVKPLKYDVFIPEGARNLPLVIITHGGGWSSNDENIMRGMAREMVRTGRYVVASIDYRWVGTLDGDARENTVADLIEDVYGAVLHIQEHARDYGADPERIALTGDSAGGHLTASMATMVERIGSGGFESGNYRYEPSYLPRGMSLEQARQSLAQAIRVVAPSYGVFGGTHLAQFTRGGTGSEELAAISPVAQIPPVEQRRLPHYLIRGGSDPLITPDMVDEYAEALEAAGHPVKRVEVPGAGHAFFDWKPDAQTRRTFQRFGVPYIRDMLEFFDQYL